MHIYSNNINELNLNDIYKINKNCDVNLIYDISNNFNKPAFLLALKKLNTNEVSESCDDILSSYIRMLKSDIFEAKTIIGYSNGYDKIYLQDFKERSYKRDTIYFKHQSAYKNIFLNLNVNNNNLDDTYVSYFNNNKIYTIGKKIKWWSPSLETSLILSNQARPFLSFTYENNVAKKINLPFFRKLGEVKYEYFFGQLEESRHIPNAKILGIRYSFNPTNKLNFAVSRTAQFGGKGRPQKPSTILDLLLGQDNYSPSDPNKISEPGNQLAALDLKYIHNNFEYYFQLAAEDEANYLPSRTFHNIGTKYINEDNIIYFDYINTFSSSGLKNYTYSHGIYKDGYRYRGAPIGANIDADSESYTFSYQKNKKNYYHRVKLYHASLNKNNGTKNFFGSMNMKLKGIKYDFGKMINNNTNLYLEVLAYDNYYNNKFETDLIFRIEFVF